MSNKKLYMGYDEETKSLADVTEEVEEEIAKVNEKIEDTLLDLANYCIMSVMWLKEHKI